MLRIYALAIMASQYGKIDAVRAASLTTTEDSIEAVAQHVAYEVFPPKDGWHTHRWSYCTVLPKSIETYLTQKVEEEPTP